MYAGASRRRLSLIVVGCRRAPEMLRQRRASTGGAKPSQLAMERGIVGQTFLSALVDVRRQECPRHTGVLPALSAHRPLVTNRYPAY